MDEKFYGEWVYYNTPEEREKAILYLELWKFFQLKRFEKEEIFDESIIDRPDSVLYRDKDGETKVKASTLGMKICTHSIVNKYLL